MKKILIIGGTADGRQIASGLAQHQLHIAVTTQLGKELLGDGIKSYVGKMDAAQMISLIKTIPADLLIDASHPYAVQASLNAMQACLDTGVEYIRYEREGAKKIPGVLYAADFEKAVQITNETAGNIFTTIGSNNLEYFTQLQNYQQRLYARVLPDSAVIEKCERLGIKNIIAVRGPFSVLFNVEMFKYANAECIVTKDSGSEGGVEQKILAAQALGLKIVMVEKPVLKYPKVVKNLAQLFKTVSDACD